jgi:aryl-alcohol dehydrogenase-like predicted oxidoreductase
VDALQVHTGRFFAPARRERHLAVVEALRPIAGRLGAKLAQLALAWVARHPGLSGVIVGSRSPDHVRENAMASRLRLDDDDLAEIEAAIMEGAPARRARDGDDVSSLRLSAV